MGYVKRDHNTIDKYERDKINNISNVKKSEIDLLFAPAVFCSAALSPACRQTLVGVSFW